MSQEQPTHQPPIAIVGLGGIFPGAADLRSFWTHILNKSDLITDVPQSHWSVQDYYDENPKKADHTYCRRGGFLPEIPLRNLTSKLSLPTGANQNRGKLSDQEAPRTSRTAA